MYGWGIIRTLWMTLYHFIMTYVEDFRSWRSFRSLGPESDPLGPVSSPSPSSRGERTHGVFTIQYPDERRELPERSRSLPFFVIDAKTQQLRCTACGICAQICPVQCIWIERAREPETGRPRRYPVSYYLDISQCMSCGYCAEFCPFDAIKMDKDYELDAYTRPGFVSAKDLAKPESYHAQIHATAYAAETAKRKR